MDTNNSKEQSNASQGRIPPHEEEKRLAAHETALISEHAQSDEAVGAIGAEAAAGAAAAEQTAAAAPESSAPVEDAAKAVMEASDGFNIGKAFGVMCLAAILALVSIFIYKGVIDDPAEKQYMAKYGKNMVPPAPGVNPSANVADWFGEGLVLPGGPKGGRVPAPGMAPAPGMVPPAAKGAPITPVVQAALASQRPVIVCLFNKDGQGVSEKGVLNQLAKSVSGTNDIVLIDAYTDPSGSEEYNQALSQRRAQAIANYLASRGVPPSHIQAVGHGETSAFSTPELCRRAEITVK